MQKPMSKIVKTACFVVAAIGITIAAHNNVMSKSSAIRFDNESARVFEAFIEKKSAGENSSIVVQPRHNEVGEVGETELQGVAPFSVVFETRSLAQDVISYEWSFGDGQAANGARVSHTFQNQGTYLVTLKTFGKKGSMRLDEVNIKVSGTQPLP